MLTKISKTGNPKVRDLMFYRNRSLKYFHFSPMHPLQHAYSFEKHYWMPLYFNIFFKSSPFIQPPIRIPLKHLRSTRYSLTVYQLKPVQWVSRLFHQIILIFKEFYLEEALFTHLSSNAIPSFDQSNIPQFTNLNCLINSMFCKSLHLAIHELLRGVEIDPMLF